MGEVWLAFDQRLERRVAIKLLRDEQRLRPGARERMLREARALSRVEHPAICQIYDILELGDADALVLEYVEGKTLAATDLNSLSTFEKLQIGIRIAEALSVAHRYGVVHRDLKAENVMLSAHGELKVLDFGVARFVAGKELPPLLAENPDLRETQELVHTPLSFEYGDFQTRRGMIVGTLHAMSPEQARGEEITAASDLFSLGLLLQEIFTGQPAYPVDLEPRALYQMVIAGTPLPRKGLDPDVDRLIGELLLLEPERRPPAAQVADRLRWIAEKPTRLAAQRRRRRITLAALGLLTTALLLVSILAWTASQARDLARRRQAQAEELITFLLKDLKAPLQLVGKLDLLGAVGEHGLRYFRAMEEEELTSEEQLRRLEALQLVAEIEMARGELESARQTLEQALAASDSLLELPKEQRVTAHIRRSQLNILLGSLDLEAADPERRQRALSTFVEAYAEARQAAALKPEDPEVLAQLGSGASGLGVALRANGRIAEAVPHLEEAAATFREVLPLQPQKVLELRSALTDNLGWLSNCLLELGRLQEALTVRQEQVASAQLLLDAQPTNRVVLNDLAVAETHLALLLEATGRIEEAVEIQNRALERGSQLIAFEPANVDWKRNFILGQGHLGNYFLLAKRYEEARRLLESAVEELSQMAAQVPNVGIWPRFEAVNRIRLARAEAALGDSQRAYEELARAKKLLQPFRTGEPGSWDPLFTLAFAQLELAKLQLGSDLGKLEAGAAERKQVLEALNAPVVARNLRALDIRSRLLIALGQPEAARDSVAWLLEQGWAASEFQETVQASPLRDLLQASSPEGP